MHTTQEKQVLVIDALDRSFRELNLMLREAVAGGIKTIELRNVYGQRYIGTGLGGEAEINIYGTPGNDLGAFGDGQHIVVFGSAQDGCGNTMDHGTIIVHGHAGDTVGFAARGGNIFIKGDVGYRAGIHMKEFEEKKPIVVIGGTAHDFLAEYMAGGIMVLLGLNLKTGQLHKANYIGTGMHGGVIYLRGSINDYQLGKEVGIADLNEKDEVILTEAVGKFAQYFGYEAKDILQSKFIKLYPKWLRPYGNLYAV